MAIIRKTLEDIKQMKLDVDWTKIDATNEDDIRRHMIEDGEDPDADYPLEKSFSPHVIRKRIGMTQEQFASALGIPVATLRNWEQGRNMIDPAARALLLLVARDPQGTLAALKNARGLDAA
jgi:putative transcriptional regulator